MPATLRELRYARARVHNHAVPLCIATSGNAAACAVNAGYELLRMRRGRRCLRSSSSGQRSADIGDVQEALGTLKTQAVGSGEGCGGGALAVGGDQVGDVALIEAVAQAPGRCALGLGAHTGLVRAVVQQSRRSAACVECE